MTTTDDSVTGAAAPAADEATIVADTSPSAPVLDIVVPVFDEEAALAESVRRLDHHLRTQVPYSARITIADNASTDNTLSVARMLAAELDAVRVVHLDAKGRGRALKAVWLASDAEIVAYCDVDLSTDLNALLPLIAPLASRHSDVAIGTRLARTSRVVRGPKREFVSRSYNVLLHTTMRVRFSDAQCGFKALRADVARELLPYVSDTGWFFDTELLLLAERVGLRIAEVPVDWVDDPHSTVDLVATAVGDLKGCVRVASALARGRLPIAELRSTIGRDRAAGPEIDGVPPGLTGQLVRFCVVGVLSTIAYAVLYLALHTVVGAQIANLLALVVTAVLNTAANRRFSFGVRGRRGALGHQALGLGVFAVGWAITALALFALHRFAPDADRHLELTVLVFANLFATLLRFVGLRWVFRTPLTIHPVAATSGGAR